MSKATERKNRTHEGRNVKRFREILGVKQEALAIGLGEEWNQKKISLIESKENIDDELMEEIARVLNVPAEAIRNFDEEKTIYNIQHNYEGSNVGSGSATLNAGSDTSTFRDCTFNPLDKLMEVMEENKALYERLLQSEKEKVELLKGKLTL
jgi:transcriptional regulator with XRE-family HTH domain